MRGVEMGRVRAEGRGYTHTTATGKWNASVWKAQGIAFEDDVSLV
jgi:hypothetical protein